MQTRGDHACLPEVDKRVESLRQNAGAASVVPRSPAVWLWTPDSHHEDPKLNEEADTWGFGWVASVEDYIDDIESGLIRRSGSRSSSRSSSSSRSRSGSGERPRRRRRRRRPYVEALVRDPNFQNPAAAGLMAAAFGAGRGAGGAGLIDLTKDGDWFYDTIRAEQAKQWADERVKKGNSYAKSNEYNRAFKYYDEALNIFPAHAAARVAKGAAFFNTDEPFLAHAEFTAALNLEPNNPDAKMYLAEAEKKLQSKKNSKASQKTTERTPLLASSHDSLGRLNSEEKGESSAIEDPQTIQVKQILQAELLKSVRKQKLKKKRKLEKLSSKKKKKLKKKQKKKGNKKKKKKHKKTSSTKKRKRSHVANSDSSSQTSSSSDEDGSDDDQSDGEEIVSRKNESKSSSLDRYWQSKRDHTENSSKKMPIHLLQEEDDKVKRGETDKNNPNIRFLTK